MTKTILQIESLRALTANAWNEQKIFPKMRIFNVFVIVGEYSSLQSGTNWIVFQQLKQFVGENLVGKILSAKIYGTVRAREVHYSMNELNFVSCLGKNKWKLSVDTRCIRHLPKRTHKRCAQHRTKFVIL